MQVVSTASTISVEADVRVEVVAPPHHGPEAGNPEANRPGGARLVAVVPDETDETLATALSRGARSVVREADIPVRLVPDLLAVARGECPILRTIAGRPPLASALVRAYRQDGEHSTRGPTLPSPLTERETAILGAIALGQTSPAIAERLGIGVQTVKNHVTHILRKTEAGTRAGAVAAAARHGWLADGS